MAKIVTLLARKGTVLLRTVLLICVLAIAATAVVSASPQDKAVEKAIKQYINVASSQYDQGLYEAAKDGLESVKKDYSGIFTDAQSSEVDQLLTKVESAMQQRSAVDQMLNDAVTAINNEQYGQAAGLFAQVRANKYAGKAQKDEAAARLKALDKQIADQKKLMQSIFDQSYGYYKQGDYDAAQAGFTQVKAGGIKISRMFGQDSDYFLAKIASAQQQEAGKADAQAAAQAEADAKAIAKSQAQADAAAQAEAAALAKAANEAQAASEKAALQAQKAAEDEFKSQMKALFDKSYKQYTDGQLEEAKEGFAQVAASGADVTYMFGRDSAYYMSKIDAKMAANKAAELKSQQQAEALAQKQAEEAAAQIAAQQAAEAKAAQAAADAAALQQAQAVAVPVVAVAAVPVEPAAVAAAPVEVPVLDTQVLVAEEVTVTVEPTSKEDSYIRVIQEKRDRQRDYTNAIVADSIMKANEAVAKGEYSAAKGSLAVAYANIDKTKMLLGDDLYSQYKTQLDQLNAQIEDAQSKALAEQTRTKRIETEELQQKIRSDVEAQRQRAVKDYLANSMAFQREQRYKEALAQLDALLAIDPLNSIALLQKETIEQTITWREQVAIQKEKHKQEIETLLNSDRATIPYSDDMTFPKNWKDIVAKRKSQQDNNFSPEDVAVYRSLEQTVDLTSFYEDMTFGEAIEVLANSMDPRATIVVVWTDLDQNAFVDKNTPINLTIPAPVKAKLGLNLLLSSVAGGLADISYVVTDGVIRVATAESLPDKMVVRKYVVTELLSPAAEFSFNMDTTSYGNQGGGRSAGGGGGGTSTTTRSTTDDQQDTTPETIRSEAMGRASAIIQLIQETIDPGSWYNAGGEGSLTTYSNNVLVIRQTLENHDKIRSLLDELRSSLGEQVAIEARFLTVTENFLEEIGLDLDVLISPGGNWNDIILNQDHADGSQATSTGVPGSLAGTLASTVSGGYVLDDLQVNFILKATQAHKDSKNLNAPKVTVLSGERAGIRVETEFSYVADFQFEDITSAGDNQPTRVIADPEISVIRDGVILNVTPTITADKKYVLLRIETSYTQTRFETYDIPATGTTATDDRVFTIQLPISQIADVRTRVTVPDGGTLLIGGQKLTGEINTEQGIPVLSKIPFLGRLFENRSKIKDNNILLILVKPTIILQDEQERNAIAAMESQY